MKILVLLSLSSILMAGRLNAQTPSERLADKMSARMNDSLSLSAAQKRQLYNINMQISNDKLALRQRYSLADSLQIKTQQVENMRDSLYRQVLTEQQFLLYKQKKKHLLNNN